MNILQPLDRDEAPDASRDVMNSLEGEFGYLPSLYRVLAHEPSALRGYAALAKLFKDSALSEQEQVVVLITASRENRAAYGVAVHSTNAQATGLDEETIEALREGRQINRDARLEALRRFTQRVVMRRGQLEEDDVDAFFAAGFEERHVLAVILGVAMNTLSNYVDHVAKTPLDAQYGKMRWEFRGDTRSAMPGRRRSDYTVPVRGSRYSH